MYCRTLSLVGLSLVASLAPAFASGASSLHQPFDEILKARVTDGQVDYPGIAAEPKFAVYLESLKNTDAGSIATREEQLAFWINAYNALVIQGILAGRSPASFFGRIEFFKGAEYDVGGRRIDLYDLEHDVIRPYGEPRIHFAIVCASRSCPKLRSEAYDSARLDAQLDEQARAFINDPKRNQTDPVAQTARLSMIFDWFREDFDKHAGSVARYLAPYLEDKAAAAGFAADDWRIDYLDYDWNLNGVPPRR